MTFFVRNKKRVYFFVLGLFLFVLFSIPNISLASSGSCSLANPFDGPIVPCGTKANPESCTLCHLLELFQNIFCFLYGILVTVALALITVSGVLYIVSAGAALKTLAKNIITKTLTGFLIFLLSWLIVFSVLKASSWKDTGNWWELNCEAESVFDKTGDLGSGGGSSGSGGGSGSTGSGSTISRTGRTEEEARKYLTDNTDNGVSFWNSAGGHTDTQGLKQETLDAVVDLHDRYTKAGHSDPFVVTGGGPGDVSGATGKYPHAGNENTPDSHGDGSKVDLEDTPALNNFIENSGEFTKVGTRGGDPVYQDNKNPNNYYVREGTHWDACIDCANPSK